jgi:hypothetical protein
MVCDNTYIKANVLRQNAQYITIVVHHHDEIGRYNLRILQKGRYSLHIMRTNSRGYCCICWLKMRIRGAVYIRCIRPSFRRISAKNKCREQVLCDKLFAKALCPRVALRRLNEGLSIRRLYELNAFG